MRFPQTFIDDLKLQADIIRIVQYYVTLKKTKANYSRIKSLERSVV